MKGRGVAVITRFDREGTERIPFLSANTLLALPEGEPAAYTLLADGIRQFGYDTTAELQELWRRLIFSLLASNSDAHHLLDLYHVMEYLAAAQKACPQWKNPHKRWLKVQKQRLLKNQSVKVIAELASQIESAGGDETPIRDAWRYLRNHPDQLDYQTACERQLPLGSGLIEGGHRHVLRDD